MIVERRPQAPENDSYTYVPIELHFQLPGDAVRRMDQFFCTTFAGTSGALEMLLAQKALVAAGARLPEVIIVLVGPGGEGKTLLTVTLGEAVWGTGHADASSSLLQVPEEFRKQGYLLAQMRWISFDECKPDSSIEEEIFKMFAGGGRIALRKNHEAETHKVSWEFCGKSWNMNTFDVPHVASAADNNFRRRLRCVFLRSQFMSDARKVRIQGRIFEADSSLKTWLASGEAACVFWAKITFPFIRAHSQQECYDMVGDPTGSVPSDTQWLVKRMTREIRNEEASGKNPLTGFSHAPEVAGRAKGGPQAVGADLARAILRETHCAATERNPGTRTWTASELCRLPTPCNPGCAVTTRKANMAGRLTKIDVFENCVAEHPYLFRVVDGIRRGGATLRKYQKRMIDVARLERTLEAVSEARGEQARDVFGDWAEWGADWGLQNDENRSAAKSDDPVLGKGEADAADGVSFAGEAVDLGGLRAYAAAKTDRRQDQLEKFIELHESHGEEGADGLSHLKQRYAKKCIAGWPLGRRYGSFLCLQFLTKEARSAACKNFALGVDMENAHTACVLLLAADLALKWPRRYRTHTSAWREAVARYYDVSPVEAKKILLKAMHGNTASPGEQGVPRDPLPFVARLAADFFQAKDYLATKNEAARKHFETGGRRDPAATCLAYLLAEVEDAILSDILASLSGGGCSVVAPIFDGAIARAGSKIQSFDATRDFIKERYGVNVCVSPIAPGEAATLVANHAKRRKLNQDGRDECASPGEPFPKLRALLGSLREGEKQTEEFAGEPAMCLPFCLRKLFPRNRCLLEFAKGSGGGPYAFGEMAERAGILFEGLETCMGAQGKYVLYEKGSGGVGHSVGLSIDARGTCVLRDRNSPTELTCRFDELPPLKDLIILKARDRPRALARSARAADGGGDVANGGAGEHAGLLCGGGQASDSPHRGLQNVEGPASGVAEPFSEAPAKTKMFLITCRTTCLFCGFALGPNEAKTETAFILTPSCVKEVQHKKKKCLKRGCRTTHCYNFAWRGGTKVNTLASLEEAAAVMVNGKWGFSKAYIAQYVRRTWWCANNATGESNVFQEMTEARAGEGGGISGRSFRTYLQSAFFYYLKMLDLHSGVDVGAIDFPIDDAVSGSPLYSGGTGAEGPDLHFLIYGAQRDDPDFAAGDIRCVVTDGNMVNARDLSKDEKKSSALKRLRGRPVGTHKAGSKFAGGGTPRSTGKVRASGGKSKKPRQCKGKGAALRKNRTGGLYLTMDGSVREGTSQGIIELREILNNEDNSLREKSLRNVKRAAPRLELWIHDLACKANFADGLVKRRMLDKFHSRAHVHAKCKRSLNPDWGRNVALRKKLRATNTVVCEQMWKHMNKYRQPQKMERSRYRAFWRHFCVFWNGHLSKKENVAPPNTTRRVKRKTYGRR